MKKTWPYLVVFAAWMAMTLPSLDVMLYIATGDHGRDFYAFEAVLRGEIPYRDFWWVYGPLMPYYYALFYLFFGVAIKSVLFAKSLLVLVSAIYVYRALTLMVPVVMALLGASWFLLFNSDIFITFNHVGGVTVSTALFYYFLRYLKDGIRQDLAFCLIPLFLLMLIKINFAFAAVIAMGLTLIAAKGLLNRPLRRGLGLLSVGTILLTAISAGIYGWMLRGLSIAEIRQCLPYFKIDRPNHKNIAETVTLLGHSIWDNIFSSPANIVFASMILLSVGFVLPRLYRKSFVEGSNEARFAIFALSAVLFFYLFFAHEYLLSGVFYRYFWTKPLIIILIFFFLGQMLTAVHRSVRPLVLGVIILIGALQLTAFGQTMARVKTPTQLLKLPRAGIYLLQNESPWISTVIQTTRYLKQVVPEGELFFALPYDPLYYFLTGKRSPTRQLIFFDHINIPPDQEKSILRELEVNEVHWVLLSSRMKSGELGMGTLGKSYGKLIYAYIQEHFEPVAEFGNWKDPAGWAWNHGTRVYRRKVN